MSSNCSDNHSKCDLNRELKRRPRSATLLNMSWLRERLKKVETLKAKLAKGSYEIDSSKIARAVLNDE